MWITFSLFLHYPHILVLTMARAFWQYPICRGSIGPKWSRHRPPYINTQLTSITTVTTMAAAGRNIPLAPHMRPCAPHQCIKWMGNNSLRKQIQFLEGWGCIWPPKCSFVPAMIHCHIIGVFWGPCTPSTPQRIVSSCSASLPLPSRDVRAERKASYGVLGGHFCMQQPWWLWLCWSLLAVGG